MYLILYINEILIAARDKEEIGKVKSQLSAEFEIKDLGEVKKSLVWRS